MTKLSAKNTPAKEGATKPSQSAAMHPAQGPLPAPPISRPLISRLREPEPTNLSQLRAVLELMRTPGVGARTFQELLCHYGAPLMALHAVQSGKARQDGWALPRPTTKKSRPELLERTLDYLGKLPPREGAVWYGHPEYPVSLLQWPEPPPLLFYRGFPEAWARRTGVAIVGARQASETGLVFAAHIARELSLSGCTTISGGALGVDAAVHRASLEAGGLTISVVATGIDVVYPAQHTSLFSAIADQGAILTEFFPGTPPVASHFPTRNRIIAGLSDAIIFIEGTERSGGLITVRKACAREKKPLFALDNPELLQGGAAWLRQHVPGVRLFANPTALLAELRLLLPA